MLVAEYNDFVERSDQSKGRDQSARLDIAIYGLAAELGSLVSALKKRLLAESGKERWNESNEEITEELGDVLWYCFSLASIANTDGKVNIFTTDIANLKKDISGASSQSKLVQRALDRTKRETFLKRSAKFPRTKDMHFEDYQKLAFLTARTDRKVLVEVCLAVLWQLGAELFRLKLPPSEREINRQVADRPLNQVLGEVAWHVAALASVYKLKLSDVAKYNIEKVSYRLTPGEPTPLHDESFPTGQRFPRKFEIAVVTIAKGRSRMYLNGRQLGNDLTDNAYDEDGYRFHDVMHLANIAKLGWSPVLRGLMGRKRRKDPKTDEVEDGARAIIVEEAIVKMIHSEGMRLARMREPNASVSSLRLFQHKEDITFRFLKLIHEFSRGLEVFKNRYWEWESAILDGYGVFQRLRREEQGTVIVDLAMRSISFRPEVFVDLQGVIDGIGSAAVCADEYSDVTESTLGALSILTPEEAECAPKEDLPLWVARVVCIKRAILQALALDPSDKNLRLLRIILTDGNRVSTKGAGLVQQEIWRRGIINIKATVSVGADVSCTALTISDPRDAVKK